MFKGLKNTIKGLNSNINNITNSEKAKKLRKNLLRIGITLVIVGLIGVIVCMGIMMSKSFDFGENMSSSISDNSNDFFSESKGIMILSMLVIPFGIIFIIGVILIRLGLSIVIAGFTSKLIDGEVGNNCPNCGNRIEGNKAFCPRCGNQLNKQCVNCGHINHFKNLHCERCGRKL